MCGVADFPASQLEGRPSGNRAMVSPGDPSLLLVVPGEAMISVQGHPAVRLPSPPLPARRPLKSSASVAAASSMWALGQTKGKTRRLPIPPQLRQLMAVALGRKLTLSQLQLLEV